MSESSNIVDVSLESGSFQTLGNAARLLAGIPGGVQKAAASAMNRAAVSGRADAAREVGRNYTIKASDFKNHTQSSQHIQISGNEVSVGITFRGTHVPLIRFNTRLTGTGLYKAQVRRDSPGDVLRHVFRTEAKGYMGLFQRTGPERLPIRQLMGPSVPQMMGANPKLANEISDNVRKTFEKRMEHEVTAILNGWRKQ